MYNVHPQRYLRAFRETLDRAPPGTTRGQRDATGGCSEAAHLLSGKDRSGKTTLLNSLISSRILPQCEDSDAVTTTVTEVTQQPGIESDRGSSFSKERHQIVAFGSSVTGKVSTWYRSSPLWPLWPFPAPFHNWPYFGLIKGACSFS